MRCVICDFSNTAPSEYNQEPHQPVRRRLFTWTEEGPKCDHCMHETKIILETYDDFSNEDQPNYEDELDTTSILEERMEQDGP